MLTVFLDMSFYSEKCHLLSIGGANKNIMAQTLFLLMFLHIYFGAHLFLLFTVVSDWQC